VAVWSVWQCVTVCVAVCGSAQQCGSVRAAVWQCAAVQAAVCGSARSSVLQCGSVCAWQCVTLWHT
jgi:hypothetical protein